MWLGKLIFGSTIRSLIANDATLTLATPTESNSLDGAKALYIDGVSVVMNGAWPCALPGEYPADNSEIKKYSLAAKTKQGFDDYMKQSL